MEGHFHLGFTHAISFGLTLIVVGAVLRIFEVWAAQSRIPLIKSVGAALGFIY